MNISFVSILLGSASALALQVALEVAKENDDAVCKWFAKVAAKILPTDERDELISDWQSDLDHLKKPTTKLITSFGFVQSAISVRIRRSCETAVAIIKSAVPKHSGRHLAAAGRIGIVTTSCAAMMTIPVTFAIISAPTLALADGCPVVLDLNLDGRINVTGADTAQRRHASTLPGKSVWFDLDGDGKQELVEWIKGTGDGFLIDNADGNALADMNGLRLFGNQEFEFQNGYEELNARDANGDSILTGGELHGIELWIDDGDAVAEEGEIQPLSTYDIVKIGVLGMALIEVQGDIEDTWYARDYAFDSKGNWIMSEDAWFFDLGERNQELFAYFDLSMREEYIS